MTVGGRDSRRKHNPSCDRTRFLCREIHRGAQASDEEKAECVWYEALNGPVTAP
jgi:hypothetical protein